MELKHPSKATQGILFIGDPHLWSFKPGRRRDASFRDTVLGKIAQAAEISNRLNLWPIFLGDLFHAPDDNDVSTLVGLVRVLGTFDRKPVTLEGNHGAKLKIIAAGADAAEAVAALAELFEQKFFED